MALPENMTGVSLASAAPGMTATVSDDLLQRVLRLHHEPYEYFNDRAVLGALSADPSGYVEAVFASLCLVAAGAAVLDLPPKMLFSDPGEHSDFRVMPCVVRFPGHVRKTVKIIGTNWPRQVVPGEISVGKAFALHAQENYIEAGFAGCVLSSARTGVCAALAQRLLEPDAVSLAVVGAGRVGYFSAMYMAAQGKLERVWFHDIDGERASLAAEAIGKAFPGVTTGVCSCTDATSAEVLVLASDSEQPLFSAHGRRAPLVISLGADTDWQSEVAASALDHYGLYVDTFDSLRYGDLARFNRAGLLKGRIVTDLLSLLAGGNAPPAAPRLFISTGSALFDNLTIDYLLTSGRLIRPPVK
jgi:ornithine cyclodeaminase/alanine dehydrogenase-like protein (mu-crystallin family)